MQCVKAGDHLPERDTANADRDPRIDHRTIGSDQRYSRKELQREDAIDRVAAHGRWQAQGGQHRTKTSDGDLLLREAAELRGTDSPA